MRGWRVLIFLLGFIPTVKGGKDIEENQFLNVDVGSSF